MMVKGRINDLILSLSDLAVASACVMEGKCATTFAGPTGLGAAFNRTMWNLKGSVIGTEMRYGLTTHLHLFSVLLQGISLVH